MPKSDFRKRKSQLKHWIREFDLPELKNRLDDAAPMGWVHPVMALLYQTDGAVALKAAELLGRLVQRLWNEDREAARNVIRRLFWSLNEESGGIGWGAPEALGAIIASSEPIAREYARLLVSLLRTQSSFIDHPAILQGILSSVLRVVQGFPNLMDSDVLDLLQPYCNHSDPNIHHMARRARDILQTVSLSRSL